MTYKLYLLDICDLEDKGLVQEALALIDDHRRVLVDKYGVERDRVRAIAAGLLLQVGFLELEPEENMGEETAISAQMQDLQGVCYKLKAEAVVRYLQKAGSVPLVYQKGVHGKPSWDRKTLEAAYDLKKLWYFNLSHSGDYVGLAVADAEVGLDIQEPRSAVRFSGGFHAFSRMEAYVKCTGEGYAKGYNTYKKHQGNVPGYKIQSEHVIEPYALNICFVGGEEKGLDIT